jgi:pimeloyl-ACP methyl ester carboxylesterase
MITRSLALAAAEVLEKIRSDYHAFVDEQLPRLLPKNPNPTVVARVRGDALAADPNRAAAILESIFAYRADLTLDQLELPIVAIDGDRQPLALDHDRAHAPQFDARILEGTSHWLMLDKPTEFASTLREVVEAIESGKAKRRPI